MLQPSIWYLILLLLLCFLWQETESISTKLVKRDLSDFDDVRLNKEQYERVQNMHYAWYLHSVKAIMGQLGKELFDLLPKSEKRRLARCLNSIIEKTDIISAAKCLTEARRREKLRLEGEKTRKSGIISGSAVQWNGAFGQEREAKKSSFHYISFIQEANKRNASAFRVHQKKLLQKSRLYRKTKDETKAAIAKLTNKMEGAQQRALHHKIRKLWLRRDNGYRRRVLTPLPSSQMSTSIRTTWGASSTSTIRRRLRVVEPHGNLWGKKMARQETSRRSPVDSLGSCCTRRISQRPASMRPILSNLRRLEISRHRALNTHRRFKRSPYRLVADRVSKSDSQKVHVVSMDSIPDLPELQPASPVIRVANLLLNVFKSDNGAKLGAEKGWHKTYQQLLRLTKKVRKAESSPGAKVYDMRMYDLVLGNEHPTRSPREPKTKTTLMEEAMELLNMMTKKSKGERAGSNGKVLSPRFAPLLPDKYETTNRHFSPSVLSFYHDDTEEQIASIPKLLEDSGLGDSERERLIEVIMELSGARTTVDGALKVLDKMNLLGMEGELLDVARRVDAVFKSLSNHFFPEQKKDIQTRGFTHLEPKQIEYLHKKQGIAGRNDTGFDLNEYRQLPKHQRDEALWARLEQIASNSSDEEHRRTKRFTLPILGPTVLSPTLFSTITGFSVLGPTILSPSLFIPLILNPAVLSPYVFSPTVGIPFILSPYLLSPYVVSPLVFAPFILNPYCVAPNVINPYVLSPLILSPLLLCPDLVSPMVLGGAILSPSALSPSVLSKSYLMAAVLSPSFLS